MQINEWKKELKKLLTDKRTGLKDSSDTNKTYNSIFALFSDQIRKTKLEVLHDFKRDLTLRLRGNSKEINEIVEYYNKKLNE